MIITVTAVSKKGAIQDENNVWYSPSKFAKDLPTFEKGNKYEVTVKEKGDFKNITEARLYATQVPSQEALPKAHSTDHRSTVASGRKQPSKDLAKTPDDVRQRLIVRQSSLAQAVAFVGDRADSVKAILDIAEEFTDWVFEVNPEAPKAVNVPKDDGTAYNPLNDL